MESILVSELLVISDRRGCQGLSQSASGTFHNLPCVPWLVTERECLKFGWLTVASPSALPGLKSIELAGNKLAGLLSVGKATSAAVPL